MSSLSYSIINTMNSPLVVYRIILFILSIFGIVAWGYWAYLHKNNRPTALIPIAWLVHVFIFYFVLLFEPFILSPAQINLWSTIIRGHGMVLTVVYGICLVHCTVSIKRDEKERGDATY